MTETTEKYIDEIPFDETCDNYCNYIEDLKDLVDELTLQNEILNKENISLKKVLVDMKNENKEYRDATDKLKAIIDKRQIRKVD